MALTINATGGIERCDDNVSKLVLDRKIILVLANFLLDKRSGRFILEVERGVVRKIRTEQIESV